jgi:hypothetical protein
VTGRLKGYWIAAFVQDITSIKEKRLFAAEFLSPVENDVSKSLECRNVVSCHDGFPVFWAYQ